MQNPLVSEEESTPAKGKILALLFDEEGKPHAIIGSDRYAEYYRDAVRLGSKFIYNRAIQTRNI